MKNDEKEQQVRYVLFYIRSPVIDPGSEHTFDLRSTEIRRFLELRIDPPTDPTKFEIPLAPNGYTYQIGKAPSLTVRNISNESAVFAGHFVCQCLR